MIKRIKEIWTNWRQKDFRNEYRIRERYDAKRGCIWYHAEFRKWDAFAWSEIDFEISYTRAKAHIKHHRSPLPTTTTHLGKLP